MMLEEIHPIVMALLLVALAGCENAMQCKVCSVCGGVPLLFVPYENLTQVCSMQCILCSECTGGGVLRQVDNQPPSSSSPACPAGVQHKSIINLF